MCHVMMGNKDASFYPKLPRLQSTCSRQQRLKMPPQMRSRKEGISGLLLLLLLAECQFEKIKIRRYTDTNTTATWRTNCVSSFERVSLEPSSLILTFVGWFCPTCLILFALSSPTTKLGKGNEQGIKALLAQTVDRVLSHLLCCAVLMCTAVIIRTW